PRRGTGLGADRSKNPPCRSRTRTTDPESRSAGRTSAPETNRTTCSQAPLGSASMDWAARLEGTEGTAACRVNWESGKNKKKATNDYAGKNLRARELSARARMLGRLGHGG